MSYVIVDEMHEEHPEMLRDAYWDDVVPSELPYTAATKQYQTEPPQGSTKNVEVPVHMADFVKDATQAEEGETAEGPVPGLGGLRRGRDFAQLEPILEHCEEHAAGSAPGSAPATAHGSPSGSPSGSVRLSAPGSPVGGRAGSEKPSAEESAATSEQGSLAGSAPGTPDSRAFLSGGDADLNDNGSEVTQRKRKRENNSEASPSVSSSLAPLLMGYVFSFTWFLCGK
ncbi:hypothetical protein FOCC_FOCC012610 [Frankliniella occidentalis]|nr:hypothetical protein FOCC_FOCC012610 [Frankliniella occidentalis]